MEETEKRKALDMIADKVRNCFDCRLSKTRTQAVPGDGDYDTEIIFIGEAPGANEDTEGIPFCGASGKFLNEMLGTIGLERKDVFITNTVKCRPPDNRDPEEDEKAACRHYLEEQIKLIRPKVIVALGRHAAATLLPGQPGISKIHGKALKRPNGIVYLPLYHPAAALHNGGLRATLIDDFMKLKPLLTKLKAESIKQKEEPINQLEQEKLI